MRLFMSISDHQMALSKLSKIEPDLHRSVSGEANICACASTRTRAHPVMLVVHVAVSKSSFGALRTDTPQVLCSPCFSVAISLYKAGPALRIVS